VVDNLLIERIEIRQDSDIDIRQYVNERVVELRLIEPTPALVDVRRQLVTMINVPLGRLQNAGVLQHGSVDNLSLTRIMIQSNAFRARHQQMAQRQGDHLRVIGEFGLVIALYQALAVLESHGPGMFYHKLQNLGEGTLSRAKKSLLATAAWRSLLRASGALAEKGPAGNPKLHQLCDTVVTHMLRCESEKDAERDTLTSNGTSTSSATRMPGDSTRIIVFTKWRDSVEEIVNELGKCQAPLRIAPFIGQVNLFIIQPTNSKLKKLF